ncbi:MAG: VOC family protein [Deltaproteobacteria bacterium]|nr:VOC family protein [Candidatus Zymogenaceae bacterium]
MYLHHSGIKSADIKKSIDFYTRVLGLEVLEEVQVLERTFYFVGNDRTRIEIEEANPGDEMMLVDKGFGLYHLAFAVDDIEGLAARLKRESVKFIMEPMQLRADRKIAFIEDPDGVRIQLIEFV